MGGRVRPVQVVVCDAKVRTSGWATALPDVWEDPEGPSWCIGVHPVMTVGVDRAAVETALLGGELGCPALGCAGRLAPCAPPSPRSPPNNPETIMTTQ